jgi:hypothetical protein
MCCVFEERKKGWRNEAFPYKRATKRNPQAARQERATVPACLTSLGQQTALTGVSVELSRVGNACPSIANLTVRYPKDRRMWFHPYFELYITHLKPSTAIHPLRARNEAGLKVGSASYCISCIPQSPTSHLSSSRLEGQHADAILAPATHRYNHAQAKKQSP